MQPHVTQDATKVFINSVTGNWGGDHTYIHFMVQEHIQNIFKILFLSC